MKGNSSTPTNDLEGGTSETGLDTPPGVTHEGFGHALMPRSPPSDLGAKTNLEIKTDGMPVTMSLPNGPEILAETAE